MDRTARAATPALLDPGAQPRFVNEVPKPPVIDASRPVEYVLRIEETQQWAGLVDAHGHRLMTTVWGYAQPGHAASWPGPTIVAHQGQPVRVLWDNALPRDGHLLPVDETIHLARPTNKHLVPTVPHLHGGHSSAEADGGPEAWFTQNPSVHGPAFPGRVLTYDNDQQSATLWYHDHALGLTRLNVYAGLAGFYLLRDSQEERLVAHGVLPDRAHEVGLAIQDRAFTADGQLYYPAHPGDPIPGTDDTVPAFHGKDGEAINPTAMPEFFGDVMTVNGMAWPKMAVQPTTYRLHLLNGSDSRFEILKLSDPHVKVTLVGGDGGLLGKAVTVMDGDGRQETGEQIVLAPGDRVDAVFDFSRAAGTSVTLENVGPAFEPFQGFGAEYKPATGTSAGEVMRFDVGKGPAARPAGVKDGTVLNAHAPHFAQADAVHTRKLGLFEGADDADRVMPMLGVAEDTRDAAGHAVAFGPLMFSNPVTEVIRLGATERWEIYNFTADAHPVHLHLVQFQVMGRHEIRFTDAVDNRTGKSGEDGVPDDLNRDGHVAVGSDVTVGKSVGLLPTDLGWQDTAWVAPGQSITVEARFDRPGEYVWHCHILSHEDNEMMRPFLVTDHLMA